MKTNDIYLDNAITTRIDPLALEEMSRFERENWGVSTQAHSIGREARKALNRSRERLARCLDVEEKEIVFTSGATEANNLALLGVARALRQRGNHIITSRVEHSSVLLACRALEKQGFAVTYLPVNGEGLIDPDDVVRSIRDETILISVIFAEGETGAVQPIRDIADIATSREITFHTDAAQAVGKIPVTPTNLGVNLLSLSAHKFHGPKGIGALYVRAGTRVTPLLYGSSEQVVSQLRPGAINIANSIGMAKALELATHDLLGDMSRVTSLRNRLFQGILSFAGKEHVRLNGPTDNRLRLPGSLCLRFEGLEAEALLLNLDMAGIYIGAGNPCASGALEPSSALLAMGLSPSEALCSVRFTFTRNSALEEVDLTTERLGVVVNQLRSISV